MSFFIALSTVCIHISDLQLLYHIDTKQKCIRYTGRLLVFVSHWLP